MDGSRCGLAEIGTGCRVALVDYARMIDRRGIKAKPPRIAGPPDRAGDLAAIGVSFLGQISLAAIKCHGTNGGSPTRRTDDTQLHTLLQSLFPPPIPNHIDHRTKEQRSHGEPC